MMIVTRPSEIKKPSLFEIHRGSNLVPTCGKLWAWQKKLVFAEDNKFVGWACKNCGWVRPLGRFVAAGDPIPADLQADFDAHDCAKYPPRH
jgi:hypothetical protein